MNQQLRIHQLDAVTANAIAAGEVVERPASVVKELCENSLDAGADTITVSIEQGGIRRIQVTDSGSGMSPGDARMAFESHATSKISHIDDLEALSTMGFRGEALPSIAAVSKVTLETREAGSESGTRIVIEGGRLMSEGPCGCQEGTSVTVTDLFYNTPARYKFLKKDSTEAGKVSNIVTDLVLSRPDISFRLSSQDRLLIHSPGNNDLTSAVYALYGQDVAGQVMAITPGEQDPLVRVSGLLGKPGLTRKSRTWEQFFVNSRPVESGLLVKALEEGAKPMLMTKEFPFAVVFVDLPPHLLDVNVHPRKLEVRFWNDQQVFKAVYYAVRSTLESLALEAAADDTAETGPAPAPAERAEGEDSYPAPVVPDRQLQMQEMAEPSPEDVMTTPASEGSEVITPAALSEADIVTVDAGIRHPDLEPLRRARWAGQLFRTYLFFEAGEAYFIIDQHAAHEKILFEQMMGRQTRTDAAQPLLEARIIQFSPAELAVIQSEEEFLRKTGFIIEPFGPGQVALRAVPFEQDSGDPADALRFAVDELMTTETNTGLRVDRDELRLRLATAACKAAVKAHDHLTAVEVDALIAQLLALESPYQCPHGRPIILRSSQRDLEKRFRRVVS